MQTEKLLIYRGISGVMTDLKINLQPESQAAQLALAWVLAQSNYIVPIPGTKRIKYLEENVAASSVVLTTADLKELDKIAPVDAAAGNRYAAAAMKMYDLDEGA